MSAAQADMQREINANCPLCSTRKTKEKSDCPHYVGVTEDRLWWYRSGAVGMVRPSDLLVADWLTTYVYRRASVGHRQRRESGRR